VTARAGKKLKDRYPAIFSCIMVAFEGCVRGIDGGDQGVQVCVVVMLWYCGV